jgi:tRNA-Thr(GGU) m(6)t(6)A37 methyltransferase TsaA
MTNILNCNPIGYFHSSQSEKYMAPRQSSLGMVAQGQILLSSGCNFEQALEDLEGFERIWLIYWIHRNQTWKPKVTTPRGGPKRGVFATRSPHRPNPLGLSCVTLLSIHGRKLTIGTTDLLDGTPILDIKPYIPYADAFPESKQGWIAESPPISLYPVSWTNEALDQVQFIAEQAGIEIKGAIELRLRENPFPFPSHRIKMKGDGYELSFKTWRVAYTIAEGTVVIQSLYSGYDSETLCGLKPSRWDDVPIHCAFIKKFYLN